MQVCLQATVHVSQWRLEQVCKTTKLAAGAHSLVLHSFVRSKRYDEENTISGGGARLMVELDGRPLIPRAITNSKGLGWDATAYEVPPQFDSDGV